jgi:hypothetical protein
MGGYLSRSDCLNGHGSYDVMMKNVEQLREWANSKVRDYERDRPTMPTVITYKVPGSTGNVYTLTVTNNNIKSCSCPGFTYRRNCKHLSILETSDG